MYLSQARLTEPIVEGLEAMVKQQASVETTRHLHERCDRRVDPLVPIRIATVLCLRAWICLSRIPLFLHSNEHALAPG
jgi:uncharacterized membrane protein (UPF0182 family)